MKLTVYIDLLLLVNRVINYCLLKITAHISGVNLSVKRTFVSSFAGALFSFFIFADMGTVAALLVKITGLFFTISLCFGNPNIKTTAKNFIVYISVNCFFTGILTLFFSDKDFVYINNFFCYININPLRFVFCVCAVYVFLSLSEEIFRFRDKDIVYRLEIFKGGKSVFITGFYDTGFRVKDVLTGKAVILCSLQRLQPVIAREMTGLLENFTDMPDSSSDIVPIFFSDMSGKGILPAIKPDKVIYKNKELKNVVIAVTASVISEDADAIFGKEIFNMTGE